jgi:cytidylate kinase
MTVDTTRAPGDPIVVTIYETYGAGAARIGARVAELLGLPFHPQAFSSEEIERAETDREGAGPVLGRVLSALDGSAVLSLGYGTNPGQDIPMAQRDTYELTQDNTRIVLEEARQGGVIVGRNATYLLRERPATLHVKLDGPVDDRIRRAAQASGIEVDRAAQRQKREDQLRAEMSLHFYGWDPRELDRYDLVVNTARLDEHTCAALIVAAAELTARTAS